MTTVKCRATYDVIVIENQFIPGMVAEGYNVKVEGASLNRSEVYEHYLAQATRYAGMARTLSV